MTGLKVLVTRPKEQAELLAEQLSSKGFSPILAPMIELAELSEPKQEKRLTRLRQVDDIDGIIAISANAVNFAFQLFDSPKTSVPKQLDWFAVGEATAEAMRLRGLNPIFPSSRFDSEGLLAVPELSEIRNKKFLLLAGVGGRRKLENALHERGASVERVELYERVAVDNQNLDIRDLPDTMIAMSGETLESLRNYLASTDRSHWLDQPLFVSSARTAELAFSLGFKVVRVSESASEKSLVQALCRFASEV